MTTCRLLVGDALEVLRTLPDASVHCVVTSPAYFGLRSYLPDGHPSKHLEMGQEQTPAAFVARLVDVFREVRRVLKPSGIAWINIADSYASHGRMVNDLQASKQSLKAYKNGPSVGRISGFKDKDLLGIPWRCAFALQDDGWWLRQDCIWSKPNPMPESVTDRPTSSHEHIFLLSKSQTYYYDAEAIAEDASQPQGQPIRTGQYKSTVFKHAGQLGTNQGANTRNKRSVWTISTEGFPGSHYAVMPAKLVEPCILAGTSPQACEHCGAPWIRVLEKVPSDSPASYNGSTFTHGKTLDARSSLAAVGKGTRYENGGTLGWHSSCRCSNNTGSGSCVVLDPFFGSGTVAKVALSHGRSFVGIDLDERNVEIARQRIGPMLLDMPAATTPIRHKQAGTGNRTAVGFNARWNAKEAAR